MHARKCVSFALFSLLLLCSLGAMSGSLHARTHLHHRKDPVRTPLPTDNALSVYVGVNASWQSLVNAALPTKAAEFSADVSAYDLADTPTDANLADHEFVSEPLSDNPDWYLYTPTTDNITLTFSIADTGNRLGKIVVTDLLTGQVLGSVTAAADGSVIQGQLSLPWLQPVYRIEGYDKNNAPLFRLGASNGRSDQIAHFMIPGAFTPYRPATVSSARYAGGDAVMGTEGDPLNPAGVTVAPQAGFSRGCAAVDQINDVSSTNPLQPPAVFLNFRKKVCIEAVNPLGYISNNPVDQPSLATDVAAAETEVRERALSDITQLPYSDTTGHWHAVFTGRVNAVFVVPYRVAKQNTLWNLLRSTFAALATGTQGKANDKWYFALLGAFTNWLVSDTGKQSGLTAGMVKGLGDIKMLETQEDLKATPIQLSLFEDTTFTLTPDIAPPAGMGTVTVKNVGFWTTVSPPNFSMGGVLRLLSPNYTGTLRLPKGFKWEVAGNLQEPLGYQPFNQPIVFPTPAMGAVQIPVTLTVLLQLNIYTLSDANPKGPKQLNVQVKNAMGQVVATGDSQMQDDGKYLFNARGLAPGNYNVTATGSNSGAKWSGSINLPIDRGTLLNKDIIATFTANPPPPHP